MSTKEKQKYGPDIEGNILDPEDAPDSICRILRQSGKKRMTSFITAVRDLLEWRYKALAYTGRSDTEKKLDLVAKNYFVRFSRKTIPLQNHLIDPKVTDHLLSLFKVKRESPNHILLYGPPGTGKTSYALGLAQKLGVSAYEILREEGNTTSKRRTTILACLNMINGGDGSLVIVDKADNLLITQNSWFSRGETQEKGWLNQLLEEPEARMIWITNSISNIEDSVMRRFAFSVHFRAFNRRQRLSLWESVLRRHRVKSCFDIKKINAETQKRG